MMFNGTQKLMLIQHLRKLGNKEKKPEDTNQGLCTELDSFGLDWYVQDILLELITKWPLFSGRKTFPIPSPDCTELDCTKLDCREKAGIMYFKAVDMWNGKTRYSVLRLKLCLWLADRLEEEYNDSETKIEAI